MSADNSGQRNIQCSATRTAPAVVEWLASDTPARPYHIFERVCNVINADGNVLSLMLAPAEMNPLALEINHQDHELDLTRCIQPSSKVALSPKELIVGDLSIDLRQSSCWDPAPDWPFIRAHHDPMKGMWKVVLGKLSNTPASESLAYCLTETGALSSSAVTGWQARALDPIQRLLEGLSAGRPDQGMQAAGDLAGLGVGLTPGGDDFLIGLMHAIWSTTPDEKAMPICQGLADAAEHKTNRLSACSMRRAALGETSAAWQALLQGMAQADQEIITRQVDALMKLGHTSGQDALTGYLLGLTHLLPR